MLGIGHVSCYNILIFDYFDILVDLKTGFGGLLVGPEIEISCSDQTQRGLRDVTASSPLFGTAEDSSETSVVFEFLKWN